MGIEDKISNLGRLFGYWREKRRYPDLKEYSRAELAQIGYTRFLTAIKAYPTSFGQGQPAKLEQLRRSGVDLPHSLLQKALQSDSGKVAELLEEGAGFHKRFGVEVAITEANLRMNIDMSFEGASKKEALSDDRLEEDMKRAADLNRKYFKQIKE